MQYTENYAMSKPESSDRFMIDTLNSNFDLLDGLFGGLKIAEPLTQSEYNAMEQHDERTIYIVLPDE